MSSPEAIKTTKDKIKEMFLSGQILTSCGAAKDFVTADLRKYITTLKREGMDIVDRWKSSTTSKRYKEYALRQFMPQEEITTHPAEITPAIGSIPSSEPIPEIIHSAPCVQTTAYAGNEPVRLSVPAKVQEGKQQNLFPDGQI